MVSQSLWLPMMMPTDGAVLAIPDSPRSPIPTDPVPAGARHYRGEGWGGKARNRPRFIAFHPLISGVLRDNVGQELAFQLDDLVLQRKLPLLQPLHLQLVERRGLLQLGDDIVQIAV